VSFPRPRNFNIEETSEFNVLRATLRDLINTVSQAAA
jgi:hypothetical protein